MFEYINVPKQDLTSGLYILQSLGFIRHVRKSNIDFYISHINSVDRVKFGYIPQLNKENQKVHIKDSEIKIEYMQYITLNKSPLNRRRASAISSKENVSA